MGRSVLSFLLLVTAVTAGYAADCSAIQGQWVGSRTPDKGGPIPITIEITMSCNAEWGEPYRNYCDLSDISGTTAKYKCSRGSIGTVNISKGSLVWRNTETGQIHGFYTVRVSRAK